MKVIATAKIIAARTTFLDPLLTTATDTFGPDTSIRRHPFETANRRLDALG
jgi:hypothetical protein